MNPENKLARFNQFNRIGKVKSDRPVQRAHHAQGPFGPFINSLILVGGDDLADRTQEIRQGHRLQPVGADARVLEWKQTDFVKGKKFDGYWKKGYPG